MPKVVALERQLVNALSRLKELEQRPYKLPLKEKFVPGEGSFSTFLYVYEATMDGATDKQKVCHILTCLSHLAQEMLVPNLNPSYTCAEVKEALLAELDQNRVYIGKNRLLCALVWLKVNQPLPLLNDFASLHKG